MSEKILEIIGSEGLSLVKAYSEAVEHFHKLVAVEGHVAPRNFLEFVEVLHYGFLRDVFEFGKLVDFVDFFWKLFLFSRFHLGFYRFISNLKTEEII